MGFDARVVRRDRRGRRRRQRPKVLQVGRMRNELNGRLAFAIVFLLLLDYFELQAISN